MAIAFVNLGASTTPDLNASNNAASYANVSSTPPTTGILACFAKNSIAAAGNKPTLTGWNVTWAEIATHVVDTGNADRITLLAAFAAGATAGQVTADFAGETQLDCRLSFFQITGAKEDGLITAAFTNASTGNGTGLSGAVTLGVASHANNRPIAAFYHEANEATTPGWTELDDLAGVAPVTGFNTQYKDDAFSTAASASWASSVDWVGLAVEVIAATVGGGPVIPVFLNQYRQRRA